MNDNENFNEYMNSFKSLSLKEKQSVVLDQLQILAGFTNNLCKEIKVNNEAIIHRELVDVKHENYTEDDFVEAVIVYVNSIQNSICDYASGITDLLDSISEEV